MLDIHHRSFLFGTMDVHSAATCLAPGMPAQEARPLLRDEQNNCELSRTSLEPLVHALLTRPLCSPSSFALNVFTHNKRCPKNTQRDARPLISTPSAAKLPYTKR